MAQRKCSRCGARRSRLHSCVACGARVCGSCSFGSRAGRVCSGADRGCHQAALTEYKERALAEAKERVIGAALLLGDAEFALKRANAAPRGGTKHAQEAWGAKVHYAGNAVHSAEQTLVILGREFGLLARRRK